MTDADELSSWDTVYERGSAPWDIGRPQAVWVRLADAGDINPPVLDAGCGTGEHTLLVAERGLDVLGIDISPAAVRLARAKAAQRGLDATFEVGDVLALDRLGRTFATVIDSGVFHIFDDADRARYVMSLGAVVDPGGVVHLLCFSEHTPGDDRTSSGDPGRVAGRLRRRLGRRTHRSGAARGAGGLRARAGPRLAREDRPHPLTRARVTLDYTGCECQHDLK